MVTQIRQGDVLLVRRPAPAASKVVEDVRGVRVPGERSGHVHVLEAPVHELPDGRRLVRVEHPAEFRAVHADTGEPWEERHATVAVPAGWWEPITQRQYSPAARRRSVSRARYD